jgi:hypothetical protein
MSLARAARVLSVVLLPAAPLAGCSADDPTAPLRAVAGHYRPTAWTVTAAGATTDVLAAGGQLPLYLDGGGLATGRVIAPAGVAGGGAADVYFDGPYEVAGGGVRVRSDEDVFVRDMPLSVQGTTLVGEATFGEARVRVTFTRLPLR